MISRCSGVLLLSSSMGSHSMGGSMGVLRRCLSNRKKCRTKLDDSIIDANAHAEQMSTLTVISVWITVWVAIVWSIRIVMMIVSVTMQK